MFVAQLSSTKFQLSNKVYYPMWVTKLYLEIQTEETV